MIVASLCLCSIGLVPRAAKADLPPPDGTKFVGYAFKVTGVSIAPDRVLFAQPCSESSGVPMAHLAKIEEGRAISVGRRGGTCTIYNIAKSRYDEFAQTYKPSKDTQDAPAAALAAEAKKCEGGPTIQNTLPSKDPRSAVEETLTVVKLDATNCVLKSTGIGGGVPAATTASSASSSSSASASSPSSSSPPAPGGGKSGCALTPAAAIAADGAALFAVAAGALALRRGRRRRSR